MRPQRPWDDNDIDGCAECGGYLSPFRNDDVCTSCRQDQLNDYSEGEA